MYTNQNKEENVNISHTVRKHENCLQVVESGYSIIRKASKMFNISRGTIQNKLKNLHSKLVGPHLTFTIVEEELFKTRVEVMCNCGFPLDKLDL